MPIRANHSGKCPHCTIGVRFEKNTILADSANAGQHDHVTIATPTGYRLQLTTAGCPDCGKPIVTITHIKDQKNFEASPDIMFWPQTGNRPVPKEVETADPKLAEDFREAVSVFPKSKKASAALSRRCLQHILREKAGTKSKDLSQQIDEVLDKLPTDLASDVDGIRNVGNFAAHPIKSKNSGEIVEVEEGAAHTSRGNLHRKTTALRP